MKKSAKRLLIKTSALGLDVGAPLIATALQFPAMVERSAESTVSGMFVMFALISAIPMFKFFGGKMKTPSVPIIWAVCCGALIALRSIIDEMIIICAVGTVSNVVGAVMYKVGDSLTDEERDK